MANAIKSLKEEFDLLYLIYKYKDLLFNNKKTIKGNTIYVQFPYRIDPAQAAGKVD